MEGRSCELNCPGRSSPNLGELCTTAAYLCPYAAKGKPIPETVLPETILRANVIFGAYQGAQA